MRKHLSQQVFRAVGAVVQGLERRVLLSAAGPADVWSIEGDASRRHPNDVITVEFAPGGATTLRALVNGQVVGTRALAGLGRIEIGAGRGDDAVFVDLGQGGAGAGVKVYVYGGRGNDTVHGDAGDQVVYGGPGDDSVDGAAGDDTLIGGDGDDDLSGGDGADVLGGDTGDDTLGGGWGTDRLVGAAGSDQLDGGEGRDKMAGGDDKDTLKGGEGRDAADGGAGKDTLYLAWGYDSYADDPTDRHRTDTTRLVLARTDTIALRRQLIDSAVSQWQWAFGQKAGAAWAARTGTVDGARFADGSVAAPVSTAGAFAPAADHSDTNTQVAGVDEADVVETDGRYLYVLTYGKLSIVDSTTMIVVHEQQAAGSPVGLYLTGDKLSVVTTDWGMYYIDTMITGRLASPIPPGSTEEPSTTVTTLDVSDPASPLQLEQTTLDGSYVSSRAIGDKVYIVTSSNIAVPAPRTSGTGDAQAYESAASYRQWLESGGIDGAFPSYSSTAGGATRGGAMLAGSQLWVEDPGAPLTNSGVVSVSVLDVGDGLADAVSSASVAGWGGEVYASADALYLAQSDWAGDVDAAVTNLMKFDLGTDAVALAATGRVAGTLDSQFSMDQTGQHFRIATTEGWGSAAVSAVYVLDQVGSELRHLGEVGGIARGERIFAARFVGDRGYLITFQQVDPLFTIDLSDPAAPKVAGELVIPGFSNYLHPVDATHLVGLGRNGSVTQLSLFDVADIAHPARVAVYDVTDGDRWSDSVAEHDHHAFSYFPERGILAFPVQEYGRDGAYHTRMEVVKIDPAAGFTRLGAMAHPQGTVLRGVRIGDRLYAVGSQRITAADLDDVDNIRASVDL